MKRFSIVSLVSFLVVVCTATYGQSRSPGWTPYDSFNQRFLDPTRWLQVPACRYWTQELECVREIRSGQLRLAVQSYADLNSNVGNQYGNSELYFNNPSVIGGFMSKVVIRQTGTIACPSNNASSNAQAVLGGSFFNNGTSDVWAFLIMAHDSTMDDPGALWSNLLIQRQPGGTTDIVDLGGFYVGDTVIAQLEWDKPNHRFFARLVRTKTGEVFQQFITYSDSDAAPPSDPQKLLGVRAFPANCIGVRTHAGTDATFDDVIVKK